ncbi:efflux RND transporter periplasmic adaptor subunit [Deinococcus misasensis]|uniref:efflux RND transporter periplasmic adaptor subunit n=1 Tax=Deinococcus misasensis TaxID=392413 RepID=UPI0005553B00|nr:HlyD family efflux transporter periplasmic adaptor subunit [Deinococcus misasensis]
MRKLWLLGVTAALLLAACTPKDKEQSQTTEPTKQEVREELTRKVRVVEASSGVLKSDRTVNVTLNPVKESFVGSTGSGQVKAILAPEGTQVTAGQTVIELDTAQLQTQLSNAQLAVRSAQINLDKARRAQQENTSLLQAQVATARQSLQLAQKRYNEGLELQKVGGIAQLDLQNLNLNVSNAENQLQNAQDNLTRTQRSGQEDLALLAVQVSQAQNQLQNAQKALGDARVKAPFNGVINEVTVNVGEFLSTGSRAFRISDPSTLEGVFRLPPEQATQFTQGTSLVLKYGGKDYSAKLVRQSEVPGQDRLIELVARLNAAGIPAGSTATLKYSLQIAEGALVPASALRVSEGQTRVFVVKDGLARAVSVRRMGEADGKVALAGLETGQRVIFPLPAELTDGTRVEVVE